MRGFTDKALILLSSPQSYEESSPIYKYDYQLAVKNLVDYLHSVGITHDCFITDGLATRLNMYSPRWLATGAPEDMFFMRNYCNVRDYETVALKDTTLTRLRKKFPIERGLAPNERFPIVAKRVKYMERSLIASYQFISIFGKDFSVKSKFGDGRAILHVNEKKFYTHIELSGMEVPINDFLQVPYANQCLSEWGKYVG